VKWKGPLLALLGAAAVAGIAIAVSLGDGGSGAGTTGAGPTQGVEKGGTTVADEGQTRPAHRLVVGSLDDSIKQGDPRLAASVAQTTRDAGFDAVLISSKWTPGATTLAPAERRALANAVRAATRNDLQVFVFVWHGLSGATPRTPAAQGQFAAYTVSLARAFPQVRHIVIGNEPNLNTFWTPQYGPGGSDAAAKGYSELLARTYDALQAVSPRPEVIGGALAPRGSDRPSLKRDTHSPTRFIEDLGAFYHSSGRTEPIMDALAMHPYMRTSALSPSDTHAASTTITIGDYTKLVTLLGSAFGAAQHGADLPIYYTELGVQTGVPANHRQAYTDLESPAAIDAVDTETQAVYYREALKLAACQPHVRGLFILHTYDESDLAGWQSGLYYADKKPKASLDDFRDAAKAARKGNLTRCAGDTFVRTD
jgi:hypothetical protein